MKAILALEDGTIFEGEAFGSSGEIGGEVVFNTSMAGYQEILTDPSYYGQIIMLTYPLIGNYGIAKEDFEAIEPYANGLIVKELCRSSSNWRANEELDNFLKEHNIIGIEGIDTRALTRKLRDVGTMRGVISTIPHRATDVLAAKARIYPNQTGLDLCRTVATKHPYHLPGGTHKVVVLDFGVRQSTLHSLKVKDCDLTVLPFWTDAAEVLAMQPDGILISDGPGDPQGVDYVIPTLQVLLASGLPLFGEGLGHQLIALASGAKVYKMKYGNRGSNHPLKILETGKIQIVALNHGYAVDKDSLSGTGLVPTEVSLNDGTVEAMRHQDVPVYTVQYNPGVVPAVDELVPLMPDAAPFFDKFVSVMKMSKQD